jgi:hypothetical protein
MVRLGTYKQVFAAHRGSFLKAGYSDVGVSAQAQGAVAKQLTETAFGHPARYSASATRHAKSLLAGTKIVSVQFTENKRSLRRIERKFLMQLKPCGFAAEIMFREATYMPSDPTSAYLA